MRRLFLIALGIALAPLLYIYGRDHTSHEQTPTSVAAVTSPAASAPEFTKPSVLPSAPHGKPAGLVSLAKKKAHASAPHYAKAKTKKVKGSSFPEAPNLAAGSGKARKDTALLASATSKGSDQNRNFSDPMQGRWIDELSGQKARLSMGKTNIDRDCQKSPSGCDGARNTRDARLVGVVMESDRVIKSPTSPLEGKVQRGSYERGTPAVYVK